MQVSIVVRHHPGAALLRSFAERRTRFAFRRMQWIVPRAHVELADENGPRGGPDKRCSVRLQPVGGEPVVVTTIASDWRSAIESALQRAGRSLLRACERRRAGDGLARRVHAAGI
jgi:hypothetical protein